jgi:hypothetical protein
VEMGCDALALDSHGRTPLDVAAMAKAAAFDSRIEEELVRGLAVAESSGAHVQQQRQRNIEPSVAASLAIASVENGNTCIVCLAAPKDSLVLPCKHVAMCAECTKTVFTSSRQPRCPVCRSRIAECIYGLFL